MNYQRFRSSDSAGCSGFWSIANPTGPLGETLYIQGGAGTPVASAEIGIYNVGNGTISAYDNVGEPYSWQTVVPEPSTAGMLFAGLAGLLFARRRK